MEDRGGHRPAGIEELVAGARDVLGTHDDVAFAYLFGSFAKGRPRATSDVDVAVFLRGHASPEGRSSRALSIEGSLERVLGRTVQVVVLNDAPLELRRTVLGHGVPLTVRDLPARRRFYVETARRYYDMAPAREIFRRYQLRRIREGRFGG